MDEPFAALDPQTRRDTRILLREIMSRQNTTAIHVTHDLNDAWALADKVAVIRDGLLVQFGSLEEVFKRPRTPFVADFVGATLVERTVVDHDHGLAVINVNGFTMRTLDSVDIGVKMKLALRPEDIIIATRSPQDTSVQSSIRATVSTILYEGKTSLLSLAAGDTSFTVLVTNQSLERLGLTPGDTVYAMGKGSNVRVVDSSSIKH